MVNATFFRKILVFISVSVLCSLSASNYAHYHFSNYVTQLPHPTDNTKVRYVVQLPEGMTHLALNYELPPGFQCQTGAVLQNGMQCFPSTMYPNQIVFDVNADVDPAFIEGFLNVVEQDQLLHPIEMDVNQLNQLIQQLVTVTLLQQLQTQPQAAQLNANSPVISGVNVKGLADSLAGQLRVRGRAFAPVGFLAGGCNALPGINYVMAPQLALNFGDDSDKSDPEKKFDQCNEYCKKRMTWYKPFFQAVAHPCKHLAQFIGSMIYLVIVPGAYLVSVVVPNVFLTAEEAEVSIASEEVFSAFKEITGNFTRRPEPDERIHLNGTVVTIRTARNENISVATASTVDWLMDVVKFIAAAVLLKYPHFVLGPIQGIVVGAINLGEHVVGRVRH
ncbi:hypothetical protein [Endozoicomonas numazuensis]|uniref:Uncharacterized protein n=1 Tax=Endozoicomonas numazuensis TaxID=1137799 RepID=A0A081NJL7_9GAMM|nr:hypothetical protein [Endozoicomonas numazuensis]KEQ18640.1 hypothetical protein GZ78_00455 [Endozoicomonas numazuensis]